MTKKRIKRESKPITKEKSSIKSMKIGKDMEKLNSILVENFVKLQKAMTNLATKFDNLSDQMSKLLQLFEISAKSFADKLSEGVPDIEKDREFLEKLNRLLEQNKVIAKGLTLMEEKLRERVYGQAIPRPRPELRPQPSFPPATPQRTQENLPSSLTKKTQEL